MYSAIGHRVEYHIGVLLCGDLFYTGSFMGNIVGALGC